MEYDDELGWILLFLHTTMNIRTNPSLIMCPVWNHIDHELIWAGVSLVPMSYNIWKWGKSSILIMSRAKGSDGKLVKVIMGKLIQTYVGLNRDFTSCLLEWRLREPMRLCLAIWVVVDLLSYFLDIQLNTFWKYTIVPHKREKTLNMHGKTYGIITSSLISERDYRVCIWIWIVHHNEHPLVERNARITGWQILGTIKSLRQWTCCKTWFSLLKMCDNLAKTRTALDNHGCRK
jgi:hypothetical protein